MMGQFILVTLLEKRSGGVAGAPHMKAMKTTGKLTWQCSKPTIQTSVDPMKTSIDVIQTSIYRVFPSIYQGIFQPGSAAGRTLPASHPAERRMAWSDSSPGWFRPGDNPRKNSGGSGDYSGEVGTKMDIS